MRRQQVFAWFLREERYHSTSVRYTSVRIDYEHSFAGHEKGRGIGSGIDVSGLLSRENRKKSIRYRYRCRSEEQVLVL